MIIMSDRKSRDGNCTKDSKKYKKDCCDFICLEDGTMARECRYCNLSLICRQVDILPNGVTMPMKSHYLPMTNDEGKIVAHEYFCTGMYDLRPLKERAEDDKVS